MSSVRTGRRLGQAGLTLVEFMLATAIMAFVALGVAGMFPSALRTVVVGGQVTKATVLTQEMLDVIRTEPFDILYVTPTSGNGYKGYLSFDTRDLPAICPTPSSDSCRNKMKWRSELLMDTAQTGGRGLPEAYGIVRVVCLNVNTASPFTVTIGTCGSSINLLRLTATVFWDRSGSRSVDLVTYVARIE
jgi:Tfp pilus assembly protein PilV